MAEINVNEMIDGYVTKAQKALNEFCLLYTSHANIKRLLSGTENKLGAKKGEVK